MDCLTDLLQFNTDCLTALMPHIHRLKCTILDMEKKVNFESIFNLCNYPLSNL